MLIALVLIACMGVLVFAPAVWAQEIVWTDQFGTSSLDWAYPISADSSGMYVAGSTNDALPGQTHAGGQDAYVRKYDHGGTEVWTRQFGTIDDDWAHAISADSSGVYVAGTTQGTLPGQTHAGSYDVYVRKYDHDGTEVWTRQFGTIDTEWAYGVSADSSGVYVAGETDGTLPGQTNLGGDDAYVRKYDHDGTELWTRQFGTSAFDGASGVSADSSGVYVAGETNDALPGQTHAGGQDSYVRKYDSGGTEQWTRQFGSSNHDFPHGVSADSSGVYVAGSARGTLPGQTSAGGRDAYVRKYNSGGTEQWTRQFGSSSDDTANGVSADSSGVYVAGYTDGTLPGQTSAGGYDAFVRNYDLDGTELWTHQFGTSSGDYAYGISVGSPVVVAGTTYGTLPGQTSAGGGDAFAAMIVFNIDLDNVAEAVDNCPYDYNPGQEDRDGDGVGDMCDNCKDAPNGPNLGTCTAGDEDEIGNSCMSDGDCGIYGVCSMDQEDDDEDLLGDACENFSEDLKVPKAGKTFDPGKPLWVTARFTNNSGAAIQTIRLDCFNCLFPVQDQYGNFLRARDRIGPAYGLPTDVVTILNGQVVEVRCDLSQMYLPTILTDPVPGDAYPEDYTVEAIYVNQIWRPAYPLWNGAVKSDPKTISIKGTPVDMKTADVIFDPDTWVTGWVVGGGPDISAHISNIQDYSVSNVDVPTIRLNGGVSIISGSDSIAGGVLTVQFNASQALLSLGTLFPGTVWPTVQGQCNPIFTATGPVTIVAGGPSGPGVGGTAIPADKIGLLAPWIVLGERQNRDGCG
jgi:hypothetical protein